MAEGSLEAPVRHPLDWGNPDFYDEAKLDAEMRRISTSIFSGSVNSGSRQGSACRVGASRLPSRIEL